MLTKSFWLKNKYYASASVLAILLILGMGVRVLGKQTAAKQVSGITPEVSVSGEVAGVATNSAIASAFPGDATYQVGTYRPNGNQTEPNPQTQTAIQASVNTPTQTETSPQSTTTPNSSTMSTDTPVSTTAPTTTPANPTPAPTAAPTAQPTVAPSNTPAPTIDPNSVVSCTVTYPDGHTTTIRVANSDQCTQLQNAAAQSRPTTPPAPTEPPH